MAAKTQKKEQLLVIVGETASGKSALAMRLAEQFNGEIICADSRTVYKGMDIGTAKPSPEDQKKIRHHLIDVARPDEKFTVADFQRLANAAIKNVASRGKLPIMVGGSGLYIDAILFGFELGRVAEQVQRDRLNKLSIEELQSELTRRNIPIPENKFNKRYLVRALERGKTTSQNTKIRDNTLVLAPSISKNNLAARITNRVQTMLEAGLVSEAERLSSQYGWELEAMRAPAYKAFRNYFEGAATLEEAKEKFIQNDLKLAKKQRTWFKRNSGIQWLNDPSEAVDIVTTFLSKKQ